MAGPSLTMAHYANDENGDYSYTPHSPYESAHPTYLAGWNSFVSSQQQGTHYLSDYLQMAAQYPYNVSNLGSSSYHHRPLSQTNAYSSHHLSQNPLSQSTRYSNIRDSYQLSDVESQESVNENTMLSEPVLPPLDGFPDIKDFDRLISRYVASLSSKKQDKALIHAKRARNIKVVLVDKKTTAVESAQFRFWVKKMFSLVPNDSKTPNREKQICHEGKPVAVREKLFKILTRAHKKCQHGGRDKTSAQVRKIYSWVPKELISRFVKLCPTCQARRGSNPRASPPALATNTCSLYSPPQSPETLSPPDSRRESILSRHSSFFSSSPVSASISGPHCHENQWLSSPQHIHNPAAIHLGHPTAMTSSSSSASVEQNRLPLNYTSSGVQNGSVGSRGSYLNGCGQAVHYPQHHHY